jgi:hypothetical protein
LRRLLFPALLGFAALAGAQATPPKSDWERQQEERDWKEAEVTLPAYPKDEGLIEFFVSAASNFRFFIDPRSLSVGADDVVRYTLVARSPSGAETVSYEGMRCNGGTYKVYAFANGGVWSRSRGNPDWRPIEPKSVQRWHQALRREYFCPFNVGISTAAEGLDYLRRGGHPDFKRSF